MPHFPVSTDDYWLLPSLVYAVFCFWMLCACVYREDNRDERLSWALFLVLCPPVAAPIYYVWRYRSLRARRFEREAQAAAAWRDAIGPH